MSDAPYSLADLKRDLAARGHALGTPTTSVAGTAGLQAAADTHSATGTVTYLDGGYISLGVNEQSIISTIHDPTKLRQGVTGTHTVYGLQSAGRVDSSGVEREKVLIFYREDDDHLGHDGGCVEVFLQRPDTTEDQDMIRVWRITTAYYEALVPQRGGTSGGGGGGASSAQAVELQSPADLYRMSMQDDGSVVLYRRAGASWEVDGGHAVGRVRIDPV
ncbi:MAG TPA: hypothetical protein VIX41_05200 [Acidimicrobiales bacterium]